MVDLFFLNIVNVTPRLSEMLKEKRIPLESLRKNADLQTTSVYQFVLFKTATVLSNSPSLIIAL